ncbi:ATP-dependent RNA helicase HAS1 [Diplonema papillatum]|nr:ATP-dependent RNA helicase HAS1 [Diplonema papillatum]
MGIKGKKRKLRDMLRKAETEAEAEGGQDGSAGGGSEADEPTAFKSGAQMTPGMAGLPGASSAAQRGRGMKQSQIVQLTDEMQRAAAIEGNGEPKRKKRKPWWERSNWWVGRVPKDQKKKDDDAMTAIPLQATDDLPTRFGQKSLGLTARLVKALVAQGFNSMTEIQRRCIPQLLQNRDIVGQAKTGSGKTLAFLVPMLNDLLVTEPLNQVGNSRAVIITPTKELSHQIHGVAMRLLDGIPDTSITAQLITGGTKVAYETALLKKGVTMVVATPGRLLDHMRHTKEWKWKKTIEWLIIDEADRVLREGFSKAVDAILQLLSDSPNRTTALFSATMARGMAELGRLSFSGPPLHVTDIAWQPREGSYSDSDGYSDAGDRRERPSGRRAGEGGGEEEEEGEGEEGEGSESMEEFEEYEEVEEVEEMEEDAEPGSADEAEPASGKPNWASSQIENLNDADETFRAPIPTQRLKHHSMVIPVPDKLIYLYKVLRDLTRSSGGVEGAKKIIVFFASCASAQFHCMVLSTILEGSLQCLMLHGKMKHRQRVATFDHFCAAPDGVLFSTDVSARGLDIPAVEWIVQYDPPTDPSEYLHRVGRTARGGGSGNALLMLTPKEVGFLKFLGKHGITITPKDLPKFDAEKYHVKLHELIMEDHILEKNARSAYKATVMAYQQHTLKEYFNAKELPLVQVGLAFCLGESAPQVHLAKGDGERAPYIKGVVKSMRHRHMKQNRWEKGGKAKKQWEDGRFVGRKHKSYVV